MNPLVVRQPAFAPEERCDSAVAEAWPLADKFAHAFHELHFVVLRFRLATLGRTRLREYATSPALRHAELRL